MVSREPRNEQPLCNAVAGLLAERVSERIVNVQPIDTVVRDRPAVECIYETTNTRFAVEHTRIESFTNQIAHGKQFARLLEPLEVELAGKLPGAFFLIVGVGLAQVPANRHEETRQALRDWILATGATLDSEETTGPRGNCDITATPPGVPFEVTLHRDCDYESCLFIMQGLSGELDPIRWTVELRRLARGRFAFCH